MPKLVLNYSCSATAKKLHCGATGKTFFCQNGHFSVRFFGDFVPRVLNKSLVMFDMCFAKFFFHVNRHQSHVREILATVLATGCKFMANDDSERTKARFSGKMF